MGMMRGGIFDIRGSRAEEKRLKEKAEEVLKRIGMYELRGSLMKNLPYGRQKISEIGRAMMNDPKLILLDEPAAGVTRPGRPSWWMLSIRPMRTDTRFHDWAQHGCGYENQRLHNCAEFRAHDSGRHAKGSTEQ